MPYWMSLAGRYAFKQLLHGAALAPAQPNTGNSQHASYGGNATGGACIGLISQTLSQGTYMQDRYGDVVDPTRRPWFYLVCH
jgi:hypothetical protein